PWPRIVPAVNSVANAASRPSNSNWASACGSARLAYASSTRTALRTSQAALRAGSTFDLRGCGAGFAEAPREEPPGWRRCCPAPRRRGSAICEDLLDQFLGSPGHPGIGDDFGQLVPGDLTQSGLLDQDGVVVAEVVDREEGQIRVIHQRGLLPRPGRDDDEQIVIRLTRGGVLRVMVWVSVQQEALALLARRNLPGGHVTPRGAELG